MTEAMNDKIYLEQSEQAQTELLLCLRALEEVQQSIQFQHIRSAQIALKEATAQALATLATLLDPTTAVPTPYRDVDIAFRQAFAFLRNAIETFSSHAGADFGALFISSRSQQCSALALLYRWRRELTVIEPYFRMADDTRSIAELGENASSVGITHHRANDKHNEYSLYVPETYDPNRQWPLIVCLHGGYGSGNDYIWSWLRVARSRGYLLLSPKSHAQTWSIVQPPVDVNSIMTILDGVLENYAVDSARVYLSGLSDGATFSYILGLQHANRFCALAPIAGVLSPATDIMLRAGLGKELPMHVIHGAHDAIFPVQTVRSTNTLLTKLGYNLKYTELSDWGHALTYVINEELVLPWFEQLSGTPH
jgi:phospholipase/carboxylesterase